ncbi:hypothetical protein F5148DRAFT_1155065 [Russula earlei]|uniref:Uncharacterized protein n=1 Tax=Russula earlei TaxID=71964 RepID=A0ACC0TRS7_9AGAM|nr:hypothetical protein F5148DRAFT_1155065 [Russula earlei]
MTRNIEYPRRERAPMRSWTQAQRGVLKPVRGEGDTKACLSFQRSSGHVAAKQQGGLACLRIGRIVVVAAAVDTEAVAVARWGLIILWGDIVAYASEVAACSSFSSYLCGSEMAVGGYEMAVWLGSRGMGGKCEFIGISIGVMAETDGAGATMEGTVVDREGTAVGDVGIGVEMTNGEGVTEAVTVMTVGEAGAVMTADKVKMVVVTLRARELTGQRQGGVEVVVDVAEKAGACTDVGMDVTGSETAVVDKMGSMMAGGMKAKATGGGA